MKFSATTMHMLKVLAVITSVTPMVHSEVTVQNDGLTYLGQISAVGSSIARSKTDGWIDGDTLFIVTDGESSAGQILSVPINRNCKLAQQPHFIFLRQSSNDHHNSYYSMSSTATTGKIMDFNFAGNTTIRSIDQLTHLARDPTTGQFATCRNGEDFSIWSSDFLSDTGNAIETVIAVDIDSAGITDTVTSSTYEFNYAYGVSFSPVITVSSIFSIRLLSKHHKNRTFAHMPWITCFYSAGWCGSWEVDCKHWIIFLGD